MTPSKEEPKPGETMRAAQPQLDWAIATRCAYLGLGAWVPLLVEFRVDKLPPLAEGQTPLRAFVSLAWLPETLRNKEILRPATFPEGFELPPGPGLGPYPVPVPLLLQWWVVFVRRGELATIAGCREWHDTIVRAELGAPLDIDDTAPVAMSKPAPMAQGSGSCGRRVVLGVIDEGIPFAHARFRSAGGSRIAYLWQQAALGNGQLGNRPGRILDAAVIDAALAAADGDEDRVYRAVGGLDYLQPGVKALGRSRSHGAHVLDLAAGADPSEHVDDRPIIAVDMPNAAIGDPSGSLLTPHALLGLLFILEKARAMRRPGETLPIIVNLSYGPHEGPHDGTSILETAMDYLIAASAASATPMRIVLAAGNARQARAHAAFELRPRASQTLAWRLQPGSLAPSRLRIELPRHPALGVEVELVSPSGGPRVAGSGSMPQACLRDAAGRVIAQVSYLATGSIRAVELTVAPTGRDPAVGAQPVAPSGLWTVIVRNLNQHRPLHVHAWIARSDTPSGRPARGRQSYFDDPDDARFDAVGRPLLVDPPGTTSYVRRSSTLSGIATGALTDVVGARAVEDPAPRRYSSAGPHLNPLRPRAAPESLAPGDRSAARRGVLAAGTRSGSVRAMNGTSVAAPQAARWLADQWLATGMLPQLPASIP